MFNAMNVQHVVCDIASCAPCQKHVAVLQAVHQSSAGLRLGLIGMAEDMCTSMAHSALEHLLQYGDTAVRSATCFITMTVMILVGACSNIINNTCQSNDNRNSKAVLPVTLTPPALLLGMCGLKS